MSVELFAGMPVKDYAASVSWYEQLLGGPPTLRPTDTEAVWELAVDRWVVIEERPARAGQSMLTIVVEDLDAYVAQITARGLEPWNWESNLPDGVRKAVYRDPDGNEFGVAGAPRPR